MAIETIITAILSTTLAIATLTAGLDKLPSSLTENMRFAMKNSVFNTNGVCAKISIIHEGLIKIKYCFIYAIIIQLFLHFVIPSFINFQFHFFTIFSFQTLNETLLYFFIFAMQ